jgi:hypothetical protein
MKPGTKISEAISGRREVSVTVTRNRSRNQKSGGACPVLARIPEVGIGRVRKPGGDLNAPLCRCCSPAVSLIAVSGHRKDHGLSREVSYWKKMAYEWSRRSDLNRRPADYESAAARFSQFYHLS